MVVVDGRTNPHKKHEAICDGVDDFAEFADLIEASSNVAINPIRER